MNFEFWEAAELVRCPENSCQSNEQTFDTLTYRGKHRSTQLVLDRKSTRLNSSHLVISYAVFCLKKKKDDYECRFPGRARSRNGVRRRGQQDREKIRKAPEVQIHRSMAALQFCEHKPEAGAALSRLASPLFQARGFALCSW